MEKKDDINRFNKLVKDKTIEALERIKKQYKSNYIIPEGAIQNLVNQDLRKAIDNEISKLKE